MEQNKVRSYILYAIGEVFLVVVGILIALQVNNWNEERQEVKNERILLEEVMEALHADSLALEELANFMDQTFEVYTQLFEISGGRISPDSLRNVDLIRASAGQLPVSKANYPDFASKVLSNELKNSIFEYYQELSIWIYIVEEYNRFIEENMRPFLGSYELLVYGFHHTGSSDREGKIDKEKLIEVLYQPAVQQVLFEATQKTRNYVGAYSLINERRNNLLNMIRSSVYGSED